MLLLLLSWSALVGIGTMNLVATLPILQQMLSERHMVLLVQ